MTDFRRIAARSNGARFRSGLALVAGLVVGCSNPTAPPDPPAFDRPEDVTFFCWNLNTNSVTALADCTPAVPPTITEDLGTPPEGYALHALVTQTTTGEVAAVRITGVDGEPGVIDTDVRIPGFTFAAVGEVPSALAVSRLNPEFTFVLGRGSNDVHVIETADFRGGVGAAATPYELPGTRPLPSAMRLTPDEDALVVALPETGQLARASVAGGVVGTWELLDLSNAVPAPVDLSVLPAEELPPRWRYICNTPALFEPPVRAPREPLSLGMMPAPSAIIEDPISGELLVADRVLPVIHIIDPVTFTETRSVTTSVPVSGLALTPLVPGTIDDTIATERYLYAIDETDGSVLALDWSDPASSRFGAVLSVEVGAPFDRLAVPFQARTLAVVSPQYSADEVGTCVDGEEGAFASGINFHGVFLAVGTVDGRVRFFDVFDEDTNCRGFTCGGSLNRDPDDEIVAIGRHRARLGSFMSTGVEVSPDPLWATDGLGTEIVTSTGGTNAPDLVPAMNLVTCDAPLDGVFNDANGEAFVCAVRDPWAAISQTFLSLYEGALPFTTTTGANFESDGSATTLLAHTDYCSLGVIGSGDVPATGYLSDYAGDVVAITGDLPPSVLNSGDESLVSVCESFTERTTAGEITPILIAIAGAESHPEGVHESYAGRLTLGEVLRPAGTALADVMRCYPELLQVEVRTRDVFTVTGGRNGFQHPVVENPDTHRCEVDAERADSALLRGRAAFDATFRTPEVTFALGSRPADISGRHPQLSITVSNVPTPLTIDVSSVGTTSGASLLTRLVYNAVDERLYAVDQSVQGLLRIKLTRLTVQQTFR